MSSSIHFFIAPLLAPELQLHQFSTETPVALAWGAGHVYEQPLLVLEAPKYSWAKIFLLAHWSISTVIF